MTTPDSPSSAPPIACTLDAGTYAERVADIRRLFDARLRSARREDGRLLLTFDPNARDDVQDLVRKERACCAFLDFALSETEGQLLLTITPPPDAPEAVDSVFAEAVPAGRCTCSS